MEWWWAFSGVLVLGFQTAISPCPLATNIAAMSYMSRRVSNPRNVLFSGLLYTFGRALTYVLLAFFILGLQLFSGDQIARYFSSLASIFLGPMMIMIGIVLLGWLSFPVPSIGGKFLQKLADRLGFWSAFPLGMIFALAFCPTVAAMFLGMLVLAARFNSLFLFPLSFGISSTLPFLILAGIIAYQVCHLGKILNVLQKIDTWMRTIAGAVFIAVGIYLSIRYNFS